LSRAFDDGENVVKVVGHPRRQLAQGVHFLAVEQLVVRLLQFLCAQGHDPLHLGVTSQQAEMPVQSKRGKEQRRKERRGGA
jgi:hypothetical protein